MNNFLCKIFLLLFFLFRFVNFINAQNWTVVGGGPYGDFGKAIGVDKIGNVYSYAFAGDSVIFQDTSFTDWGLLLSKFDSAGERQWIIRITASWAGWGDMLVDSNGNIYISGVFSDTITIADTTLFHCCAFYNELFLAKFNTDGILQWARRSDKVNDSGWSGGFDDIVFSGFDGTGNVQLILFYLGNLVVLGNDSLYGDGYDHALARIDTNGNFIWNKLINNGANDFKPVLMEPSGNFYLAGTNTFSNQNYIMKFYFNDSSEWYDATSTFLWNEPQEGEIVGFASDSLNNAYTVIRVNADTFYLKKYNQNGSIEWQKRINLKPGSFEAFAADENGNIAIAASNDTIPNYAPLYIEKYDSFGNWLGKIYVGVRTNLLAPAWTGAYDISINNNFIYLTGDYLFDSTNNSLIFINDTITFCKAGGQDIFITKLHSSQLDSTPLSTINISFDDAVLMLIAFPNPFSELITLHVTGSAKEKLYISILNLFGETVYLKELHNIENKIIIEPDLHFLTAGIYFFQVEANNKTITLKIIKQ